MGMLRLYLAVSVLLAHAGPLLGTHLAGGPPAVQAFFAISGFYMSLVLHEKYRDGGRTTLLFWLNRLLRLAPLYLVVLSASLAIAWRDPARVPFFPTLGVLSPPWRMLVGAANLTGVGLDGLLFTRVDAVGAALRFCPVFDPNSPLPSTNLQLVGQGWTLSLEAYFYLLAPWLVRLRLRWLLLAIGLSVACRLALAAGPGWHLSPFYYQFFPSELATFLLGALAYRGYRRLGRDNATARRLGGWGLLGVLLLTPLWFRLPLPARSLGYAVMISALVPALFMAFKSSRVDRWVGELSYPVYLLHGLVLRLPGRAGDDPAVVLAITLVAAALAVVLIEWPVERLRQRVAGRVTRGETPLPAAVVRPA